jgi:hypothetical protein
MNTKSIIILGLLVVASLLTKAADMSIKVSPRTKTNEIKVHYFPTPESTLGRIIKVEPGLTIFFEMRGTNTGKNPVYNGDVFSFGGYNQSNEWVSLNMQFRGTFDPNMSNLKRGLEYIKNKNLNFDKPSTNWQSYGVTIRKDNLLNSRLTLVDMNAMFFFTDTQNSAIQRVGLQVRNIWVINESYSDIALSILNNKDKDLMELDKVITINWYYYHKFLQISSDIFNWTTIPVELTRSDLEFTMPFFQDNMFFQYKN